MSALDTDPNTNHLLKPRPYLTPSRWDPPPLQTRLSAEQFLTSTLQRHNTRLIALFKTVTYSDMQGNLNEISERVKSTCLVSQHTSTQYITRQNTEPAFINSIFCNQHPSITHMLGFLQQLFKQDKTIINHYIYSDEKQSRK